VLWPKYQIDLDGAWGIPATPRGRVLAEHSDAIPDLQLVNFNAYTEGWALYAEQSVDGRLLRQ
jgi:hypothetical protein